MKQPLLILLGMMYCGLAWPQAAPPAPAPKPVPGSPQADAGEPRANASAQSEAGEPRADTSATPAVPAAPSSASKPAAASAAARPAPAAKGASDRLQLGTATVTGDREQPKVMYIVPWKRSDMGDLEGKPMNSLVDEILSPVDRDVFRREVRYYQTVNSDASQNAAKAPPGQVEK